MSAKNNISRDCLDIIVKKYFKIVWKFYDMDFFLFNDHIIFDYF